MEAFPKNNSMEETSGTSCSTKLDVFCNMQRYKDYPGHASPAKTMKAGSFCNACLNVCLAQKVFIVHFLPKQMNDWVRDKLPRCMARYNAIGKTSEGTFMIIAKHTDQSYSQPGREHFKFQTSKTSTTAPNFHRNYETEPVRYTESASEATHPSEASPLAIQLCFPAHGSTLIEQVWKISYLFLRPCRIEFNTYIHAEKRED